MTEENKTSGALAAWVGGGAITDENRAALGAALKEAAGAVKSGGGSGGDGEFEFLTFSGQGARYTGWMVGRDKRKPDPDAVYIVNAHSAVKGIKCWKSNAVVGHHQWSAFKDATDSIKIKDAEDHGPYPDGDGWKSELGISMVDVDNPDMRLVFATTTVSAINSLGDLIEEIGTRIIGGEPEFPIVTLGSDAFTTRGKPNGKPTFNVEGWVTLPEINAYIAAGDDGDLDDLLAGEYDEAAEEEAPAPTKRRARRTAA